MKIKDWFTKRSIVTKILLILISGSLGWLSVSRIGSLRERQPQYQTAQVERETIVSSVSASGQILTSNMMNITTGASGIIKQVFVSEGQKVNKGDKIAEIELDSTGQQKSASAWSSYLSAKNTLDSANITLLTLQSDMFTKWDTFKTLAESSTYQNADGSPRYTQRALPAFHIAEKNWLAAEAKYKNQNGVITQAKVALNNAWLSYQQSAPIVTTSASGIIENITVVPGITIGDSEMTAQTIAVIRNQGNPLASFNFAEIDVTKIKIGQKATITVDAISGKTFTGRVVSIDKIGEVVSNVTNYPVLIQLDTNSEDLLPNMTASASVITETKDNVLFVPSQAVQTVNNQTSVRVIRKGQIESIPVEVGISSDQGVEIISGLSEGDEVVIGTVASSSQQGGTSPFGGFGGFGGLRPGGFGGAQRNPAMQH